MKITWTIPANKELRKIYSFYKKNASVKVAQSIKECLSANVPDRKSITV